MKAKQLLLATTLHGTVGSWHETSAVRSAKKAGNPHQSFYTAFLWYTIFWVHAHALRVGARRFEGGSGLACLTFWHAGP